MIRMTLLIALFTSLLMAAEPTAPKAPETFTLKAAGQTALTAAELPNGMRFKGYEGKPVLLNFFGKNCRYCMHEIPHLVALKKKYGDKIGIIGIHVQERMSFRERNALQQRLGFNYPIFEYDDNVAFVRHVGSRAGYNGSIPFNIVFNAKGEVVEIIPGYLSGENLEMIFSELLK